jgi:regulator of replication initiation timing
MEIEVKQEDVQAVMQANPVMALQVENQALRRKLQETVVAFDGAMSENKRLAEEMEKSKNGKSQKGK